MGSPLFAHYTLSKLFHLDSLCGLIRLYTLVYPLSCVATTLKILKPQVTDSVLHTPFIVSQMDRVFDGPLFPDTNDVDRRESTISWLLRIPHATC